jgi:hypothetical protein
MIHMPSYEEMRKLFDKSDKEREEIKERRHQARLKELEKMGIKPFDSSQTPPPRCDHPNTIEDGTSTVFWIVAMVISLLFKGGWALCVLETIIWWKFNTRYSK